MLSLLRLHSRLVLLVTLLMAVVLASLLWYVYAADRGSKSAESGPGPGSLSQGPPYLGLDAYRHLDKLSYIEMGDRVAGQSTADLAGSNADNIHYLRVLPNGAHVLFDQVGPGIVTFMRMQEDYGGPWMLSLDNHVATTISSDDLGRMNLGSETAFPYPLSLHPRQSRGSSIIASTIPFQQSMQWTSQQANGNFYALYRKLPYGTRLPAWNSAASNKDVVHLLRRTGQDIAPEQITRQSGSMRVEAGTPVQLAALTGPSQIRALTFRVPNSEMVRFGMTRLLIFWDGETKPSVDVPIKFLVGDGAGVYQPASRPLVQGWVAGARQEPGNSMSFNLYWPMPFHSSARILLQSQAPLERVDWHLRYEPFPDPPERWGTFHAAYTSVPRPLPGQDMTFLDVKGSGKLVGTVINFTAPGPTLEGDPRIYIDDSQTPQIAVTGTEEWGLGGNYWNGGIQTSLPLGGLPSSTNNPPGADQDGAALYRFLIADSITFNRHLVVRWEHGSANQGTLPYRAALFWYGIPAQTAILSDEMLSGSGSSRFSHSYHSERESLYELTAAQEYEVYAPVSTMTGSTTVAETSFKMMLDSHNVGAFLRRTFDYCLPNQRADIFIDGNFAGTWYSAGASHRSDSQGHRRCWREEEFPLPPEFTKGKSAITLRIVFVPTRTPLNSAWTAFRYQLYSFVPPPSTSSHIDTGGQHASVGRTSTAG